MKPSRLTVGLLLAAGTALVLGVVALSSDLGRRSGLDDYITKTASDGESEDQGVTSAPDDGDDRALLRIAVAPVISPEKSLLRYFDLAIWLGDRMDRRGDLLLRDNYDQTNQLLRDHECDAALICTYSYVRLQREGSVEAIAIPVVDGQDTYHSVVIVRRRSSFLDLLSLKGARFASADTLSTTGWLFPATYLLSKDENPLSFFSSRLVMGSHDLAVNAVLSGEADVAAVHSLVYQRMPSSTRKRLRIILKSQPFGMPPVVVPDSLDDDLKEALREALLMIHVHPEGAAILARLQIDRFIVPPPDHFHSIEALVDLWEGQH